MVLQNISASSKRLYVSCDFEGDEMALSARGNSRQAIQPIWKRSAYARLQKT